MQLVGMSSSPEMYIIRPAVAAVIIPIPVEDMFWNKNRAKKYPITIGIAVDDDIRNDLSFFFVQ